MSALRVPFLDLHAAYQELALEIDAATSRVVNSGWYILGEEVMAFEREWANYCESKCAVGVGNGLDALHLALRAVGVGPGDEVIVPSHTFIATWLAVSQCGATPIPVDPIEATYNINPELIERAISRRTKAIVPVHLYGQPTDLDPIIKIAKRHGLRVVEDAAQAHGARFRGRRIGAHGDAVAWSFYPGKNLGALGDGGAVTTDNVDIADRVRMLSNYGCREKYVHEVKGGNSRLDPIQAAILRVKLTHLDEWNLRRSRAAATYISMLASSDLILPTVPDFAEPVWHLFVVRSKSRDFLRDSLAGADVATMVHYPAPPHRQGAYQEFRSEMLPLAEMLSEQVLSLPIGPQLTDEQLAYTLTRLSPSASEPF